VELRPVTPDDLAACGDVFYEAEDELYGRRGLTPVPRNRRALERMLGHIVATDPERCWLAERDGDVVAFAMASQRERFWFLSFLFVRPDSQGRGIGRRLLERCLPAEGAADILGTCVEAIQPISTGLYASYGLVPREPLFALIGTPTDDLRGLAGLPGSLEVVAFAELAGAGEERLAAELDAIDREVQGFSRQADHRALRAWGRTGFVLRSAGRPVGYGYAERAGRVGPVVVRDRRHLLPFVGELTHRVSAVEAWQILVPGAADETMVGLLRAGLRFDGPPALVCATRRGPDFARFLPGSFAIL
jgi:GNAT superfamily N-acetyltransferase